MLQLSTAVWYALGPRFESHLKQLYPLMNELINLLWSLMLTEFDTNRSELEITCRYSNSRAPSEVWSLTISTQVEAFAK